LITDNIKIRRVGGVDHTIRMEEERILPAQKKFLMGNATIQDK
jgi:hypothetical protein